MHNLPDKFARAIESLAVELSETMAEATASNAVVAAVEDHRAKIAARVAQLSAEREAIVNRRAGCRHEEGDGSSLVLVQADLEGLAPLLQEAAARVMNAQAAYDTISARAARLRAEIEQAEAGAAQEALIGHANELCDKLQATVYALDDVCRRMGVTGRPIWGAPKPLFDTLRRLAAQRGEL